MDIDQYIYVQLSPKWIENSVSI